MKFVLIFGPPAVGKMTVGQELAARTGLKLFHNHMTIDLVSNFFDYSSPAGKRLVGLFRRELFREIAASDLPGVIFTYVWAFDHDSDRAYVDEIGGLFEASGGTSYWVELAADQAERLTRNRHPHRLAHKWTKRDVDASERGLIDADAAYRMNSVPGEITRENYLRIDNTHRSAPECAALIKTTFAL